MRIALCNEVVRELPFEAQCRFACQLGYDGLEVAPFTLGDAPHRLTGARRSELRRIAEGEGAVITGLHWLLLTPAGLSITSADEAVRERTIDVMRALIGLCADLGGKVLVHGSPKQRALAAGEEESGRGFARACFAAVAEEAEAAGVVYCIEALAPRETNHVNTVAEAAEIVRMIDSPAVRTMVDCSAAAMAEVEPVADLLRRWLPSGMIGHIHLNDRNRRAPGQGEDRFGPVLSVLDELGYAGAAGVEPFVYEPDGPTTAARAIGYLQGLRQAMQEQQR